MNALGLVRKCVEDARAQSTSTLDDVLTIIEAMRDPDTGNMRAMHELTQAVRRCVGDDYFGPADRDSLPAGFYEAVDRYRCADLVANCNHAGALRDVAEILGCDGDPWDEEAADKIWPRKEKPCQSEKQ